MKARHDFFLPILKGGQNLILASFTLCCSPTFLLSKMVSLVIQTRVDFVALNVTLGIVIFVAFYIGKYRQIQQKVRNSYNL